MRIESHRDAAHKQAANISHLEATRCRSEKTVRFEILKRSDLMCEPRSEIDAQFGGENVVIDAEIAHDLHDHAAAQFVFGGHGISAGNGQATAVNHGVVRLQILRVLPVVFFSLRDSGNSESQNVGASMGAVS